ncbi:DUF6443 domain-containing protein [Solitalea canadensis]|uniref:RHS repeat-associated core domain protein n=1 Tax=Solitalea canadensis (strain ATCC 29591 / DSM 3403 / JCM 21819 / LMG 8368 / NBRC 15130 / NCIMB 12057 / USAM 9D) TaxID=929556 RepID=H8KTP5_SOLCM|nr:DUF6443 domain-containing protein [Solitalea canadensis]AFD06620.1 RHS repeat-associated core domain protein [Solitalea canadensis DSM 3403]
MIQLFNKRMLLLVVFLSIICASVFAQQASVSLSTYSGQSEIMATQSVTLLPGVSIPSGSNVRIYISGAAAYCTPLAAAPSTNQNYILTNTIKVPGIIDEAGLVNRNTCEISQTIQYFDGLGRPLQTVQTKGSPLLNDIVQPFEYDAFGREAKKYLLYVGGSNGSYKTDALTPEAGVSKFYSLTNQNYASTAYPFAETKFEASPLNRVEQQGAVGEAWQLLNAGISESGHTIKTEYGTNVANEVKLWTLKADGTGATATFYEANQLYKTTLKDENWIAADGTKGTTEEFKDKEGRVVLKRILDDAGTALSTQYVYDDFGNLRYVIPPAVTATTITENDATFNELIYAYHYDGRQRMVEKKIPAKGWEFIVYNKLDQVVLTQDAVQRAKAADEWLFTKYDALGRVIMTGLYKDGGNIAVLTSNVKRLDLQTQVDGQDPANLWETRTAGDYSNNSFPISISDTYTVIYYDNYAFPGNPFGAPTGGQSLMTRSLLTGTKVKVLDGGSTYLWTVNFYDNEGRVIQSKSTNYLSGQDVVDNTYDFPGQLKISKRIHTVSGKAPLEITTRYEYDHMGRQIDTYEKIGNASEVLLASYKYNELGQQIKKQLHSENNGSSYLQAVDYAYNIRGWLKSTTAPQFSMSLKYDDATATAYKQYNGNIGEMNYTGPTSGVKGFQYSYDKLNRLTSAVSTSNLLNESLTYDVMGNILSLNRTGAGYGNTTYDYVKNGVNSNQLQSTAGNIESNYSYDVNGNLLTDSKKAIALTYNYLNLPKTVAVNGTPNVTYIYDAAGNKLRKTIIAEGGPKNTDYVAGIQYRDNGTLDFVQTEEGRAISTGGSFKYEYNLSDHLGNIRVCFDKTGLLQEDEYYAFGLRKSVFNGSSNLYLYNGKELQSELGEYDYGARFYNPILGRWNVVDLLAESYNNISPYNYVVNNPISNIDPDGMRVVDNGDRYTITGDDVYYYLGAIQQIAAGKGNKASFNKALSTASQQNEGEGGSFEYNLGGDGNYSSSMPLQPDNRNYQSSWQSFKDQINSQRDALIASEYFIYGSVELSMLYMGGGGGYSRTLSAAGIRESIPVAAKTGSTVANRLGQLMHKAYKAADVLEGVRIKEFRLPSGKRIDFIDFENKIIYELKPNNPRAIKEGYKQLAMYLQEVESIYGKGFKTILDTY